MLTLFGSAANYPITFHLVANLKNCTLGMTKYVKKKKTLKISPFYPKLYNIAKMNPAGIILKDLNDQ